jgi:hypothetical protein
VHDVFDKVRSSKFSEYLIRGSYVELYNEDIRDLLAGGDGEKHRDPAAVDLRLKIAEDPKTGPFVKGAVERVLEKPEQVAPYLWQPPLPLDVPPMYLHRCSLHLQLSCYPLSPLFTPRCWT